MSRLLLLLLVVFSLIGCTTLKPTAEQFEGKVYICDKGGMMRKSVLTFNIRTFLYSERDSLFVGGGSWHLSEKGKILLEGEISNKYQSPNMSINKELKLELKVKGRNKLIGNDMVFIRKE
jgi:hypothetical protein